MGPDETAASLRVSVVYSPRAGAVDETSLALGPGATVADALRESGLQGRHQGLSLATAPIGIWGAPCKRGDLLRDRDRVEVYRALVVDPKEARRQRYRDNRSARGETVKPKR